MHCLWCDQEITVGLDWTSLWMPKPEKKLCIQCQSQLKLVTGNLCEKCGRQTKQKLCRDCQRWTENLTWKDILVSNRSVYIYNQQLKEMITKWKYRGDFVIRDIFAEQFVTTFNQQFLDLEKEFILVPIPLSEERHWERGFNQAESLVKLLNQPYELALSRVHGEKQSKKTRKERLESTNPFSVTKDIHQPVILIDDIYTTGMTLHHAASQLKKNGCPRVYSFTLARG